MNKIHNHQNWILHKVLRYSFMSSIMLLSTAVYAEENEFNHTETANYSSPTITNELVTGCYSTNAERFSLNSICLFADGTYLYPTNLTQSGTYYIRDNQIIFKARDRGLFSVYGRHDPHLAESGQGTRVSYSGFDAESLINFNNMGYHIRPEKPDCKGDFTINRSVQPEILRSIILANAPFKNSSLTIYSYNLMNQEEQGINDIILIAQNPRYRDVKFKGSILVDEEDVWLQLGKNVFSMQRLNFSSKKLEIIKKIGKEVDVSEEMYEIFNQENMPSLQDIRTYYLDKKQNLYFKEASDGVEKQANRHHLKLYKRILPYMQNMATADVSSRDGNSEQCPSS